MEKTTSLHKEHKQTISYKDEHNWGHSITSKDPLAIRIVMKNINNIGITTNDNPKQDAALEWLIQNNVGVVCWLEIGITWQKLQRKDHLIRRFKCEQRQNTQAFTSNNRQNSTHLSQPGGTATLTFGPVSNTIDKNGFDPSGLGCWSWVQLSGRHGMNTVIISAYNPCLSKLNRTRKVYSQQKIYWLTCKVDICPRECMRRDLSKFMTEWQNEGANIIVCADLNKDT